MKLLIALSLALLSTPALAQTPPIDWSKPVVGVDAPVLKDNQILENAPLPVEVYTIQDLKELGNPSIKEFIQSKPAELCDPEKQRGEVRCTMVPDKTAKPDAAKH